MSDVDSDEEIQAPPHKKNKRRTRATGLRDHDSDVENQQPPKNNIPRTAAGEKSDWYAEITCRSIFQSLFCLFHQDETKREQHSSVRQAGSCSSSSRQARQTWKSEIYHSVEVQVSGPYFQVRLMWQRENCPHERSRARWKVDRPRKGNRSKVGARQ